MYKSEKVINGILCSKSTPDGEYKPLSQKQLTQKIVNMEAEIISLKKALDFHKYTPKKVLM